MKNLDAVIDNYLSGNLTPDEVIQFEQFLSETPNAQEQLDLQKDIVESIKQARRNELRAKMSSMSPKAGISLAQKLAYASATIVVTALVSIGIYSTSYNNETPQTESEDLVSTSIPVVKEKVTPEEIVSVEENLTVENTKEESKTIAAPVKTAPVKNTKVKGKSIETSTASNVSYEDALPNDLDEDNDDIHQANEEPQGFKNVISETSEISREIVSDCDSEVNGYTYEKGTLQLCGDFKNSEFTIFKDASSGNFYFAYNNDFYKIVESDKFEKFKDNKLTDTKIIKSLSK